MALRRRKVPVLIAVSRSWLWFDGRWFCCFYKAMWLDSRNELSEQSTLHLVTFHTDCFVFGGAKAKNICQVSQVLGIAHR